jgi:transposase
MAKSPENGITILLGLKGYQVGEVKEDDRGIIVQVSILKGNIYCPHCCSSSLHGHGSCKPRKVLHYWRNGKKIYLDLHRSRWRCQRCKRTFNDGEELVRTYSRITKPAEAEVLWQLKGQGFSHITRELGVGYSTQRKLLEREIDEEMLSTLKCNDEIYLGIDEHSFRHQDLVHTVTEVKQRKMLAILKDDRIVTLKSFLSKISKDKVKEVCIDMKESLRKAAGSLFPDAKVVLDPFHVIADANKRMDEARRIEQDVNKKRKVKIPKKIFLVGAEKLGEESESKLTGLLNKYPNLKVFYWAKEKIRQVYSQESREDAAKLLDIIIFNLKADDDGEAIRWANTLKHWREPILNHFDNHTTNAFTEGCNTKIKMLKRLSYGLRNIDVYWRKMLLGFVPSRSYFHTI